MDDGMSDGMSDGVRDGEVQARTITFPFQVAVHPYMPRREMSALRTSINNNANIAIAALKVLYGQSP